MAATPSQMLPLGTPAPAFRLPDAHGREHDLAGGGAAGAYLVIFMCNHCPFVKHVADELGRIDREYRPQGLRTIGINSNDVERHADDAPPRMIEEARLRGWDFPYLIDATQDVAKAYRAACTPDFFLFDADRRLAYRGQLDRSRPTNGVPVTGEDLRRAIAAVLGGTPVDPDQKPSIGCNIKWKPGNAPAWFG